VNRLCKQAAVEKSLAFPLCRSDERIANYCGVSDNSKTSEGRAKKEMKETLYTP
jgi:hypothetical protein